jgi:hypothetical protein
MAGGYGVGNGRDTGLREWDGALLDMGKDTLAFALRGS